MNQDQIPTARTTRPARPPPPAAPRAFLDWPAAASAVFLLSAACLLAGAWLAFAPLLGISELLGERFALVGTVQLYEATLLAAAVLLCRWQRGNADAIGPAVLAAAFLVGGAVTLDLVSIDGPRATLACGIVGLALLAARYEVFSRLVVGRLGGWLGAGVALLAAWNLVAPGAFGLYRELATAPELLGWWLSSWWLVVIAGGVLLAGAVRSFAPQADRDQPFLRRAGMRWVLALVALAGSLVHLWVIGYLNSVELALADLLMPIALLVLVAGELRARTWGNHAGADLAQLGVPAALALGVALRGSPSELAMATPWASLAEPGPVLAWLALVAVRLGHERGQPVLARAAVGCAVLAVWTWGYVPGASLNWPAGAYAIASALALEAWRSGRTRLVAYALMVTVTVTLVHWDMIWYLSRHGVNAIPLAVGLDGLALLAVAARWPGSFACSSARIAAWAVAFAGVFAIATPGPLPHLLGWCAALALLIPFVWWLRDRWLLSPLAPPATLGALVLSADHRGWAVIAIAFMLVGVALLVAHRRVRRDQRAMPAAMTAPAIG
jgi:hypothetical protein